MQGTPHMKKRARGPGAILLRIAAIPAAVYLLLLALLYFNQERLIFPGGEGRGRPESRVRPPAGTELVSLTTASGKRVAALFGGPLSPDGRPRQGARARPAILLFYGNGTCLSEAVDTVQTARKLGFSVLCPDYVGFGQSSGSPSERGCRETADAALAHLRSRKDGDPGRVIAFDYSLGGAVAIDLAGRERLRGLVACNTFTSMSDMVGRLLPVRAHVPAEAPLRQPGAHPERPLPGAAGARHGGHAHSGRDARSSRRGRFHARDHL